VSDTREIQLNKEAFYFQGDSLLLPQDVPESRTGIGLSLDYSGEFADPEIFEIPSIAGISPISITVVSTLQGNSLPPNWKAIPVRRIFAVFSTDGIADIIRACHIVQWRHESRFCGRCGGKNLDAPAHRICTVCGRQEFPRICPAVITVITDEKNRILLAHNKYFRAGLYSHISGFNEAGEGLEETVVREIREEINIEVRDIEYKKSQPWPFPNSLMVGFKARYSSGEIRPDGAEIEDAAWFTKDNLPELPGEGSLSRFLIDCWKDGTL
jgi:NAD+ diphosphatase